MRRKKRSLPQMVVLTVMLAVIAGLFMIPSSPIGPQVAKAAAEDPVPEIPALLVPVLMAAAGGVVCRARRKAAGEAIQRGNE